MSHTFNRGYQADINKHYKTLSREEERELILRAKCGDSKASHALIQSQYKMVTGMAEKFANSKSSKDDLVGQGVLGLRRAIDLFDTSKSTRFITYAIVWVKASISSYVHDDDTIRHPSNINSRIKKAKKALLNNEEPEKELRIGMYSLDAPKGRADDKSSNQTFGDSIDDDSEEDLSVKIENKDLVSKALSCLNARQMYIFQLHFGLPYVNKETGETVQEDRMSLEEVGLRIGMTKQNVSVIIRNSLMVLRRQMVEKKIRVPKAQVREVEEVETLLESSGSENRYQESNTTASWGMGSRSDVNSDSLLSEPPLPPAGPELEPEPEPEITQNDLQEEIKELTAPIIHAEPEIQVPVEEEMEEIEVEEITAIPGTSKDFIGSAFPTAKKLKKSMYEFEGKKTSIRFSKVNSGRYWFGLLERDANKVLTGELDSVTFLCIGNGYITMDRSTILSIRENLIVTTRGKYGNRFHVHMQYRPGNKVILSLKDGSTLEFKGAPVNM